MSWEVEAGLLCGWRDLARIHFAEPVQDRLGKQFGGQINSLSLQYRHSSSALIPNLNSSFLVTIVD